MKLGNWYAMYFLLRLLIGGRNLYCLLLSKLYCGAVLGRLRSSQLETKICPLFWFMQRHVKWGQSIIRNKWQLRTNSSWAIRNRCQIINLHSSYTKNMGAVSNSHPTISNIIGEWHQHFVKFFLLRTSSKTRRLPTFHLWRAHIIHK